jgi:hypothetical protein
MGFFVETIEPARPRKAWGWGLAALVAVGSSACADQGNQRFGAPKLGSDDEKIQEVDRMHELREGVLSLPFAGEVDILYAVIDGRAIWAGDIILHEDDLQGFRAASSSRLWPEGTVKYAFGDGLTPAIRLGVMQAMDQWTIRSGIRFREVEPQGGGHLLIAGGEPNDCSAHLGYYGPGTVHQLTLGENCDEASIYAHELGHVIGLFHEQSRSDRDDHVSIDWHNIQPGFAYAFDKYEKKGAGKDRGAYDFSSIMHYPSDAFAVDPTKPTIVRKEGSSLIERPMLISGGDAMAVQAMYANQPEAQDAGEPEAQADGCTNHCGSLEPTAANCYCDAGCMEYDDCCADQQAVCGGNQGNHPAQPATCEGKCDSEDGQPDANGGHCYCDEACTANDDCCSDYAAQCGGNDPGYDGAGSCVNHCDGPGSQGESCWCDADCSSHGDCCADHGTACGGGDGAGSASCVGHCGSQTPVDDCYCDASCIEHDDCCADYLAVCP